MTYCTQLEAQLQDNLRINDLGFIPALPEFFHLGEPFPSVYGNAHFIKVNANLLAH
jgi:hypothetical protein